MTKFNVGDIVKIAKTSKYYNETAPTWTGNPLCNGKIKYISMYDNMNIHVIWDNKTENSYDNEDLVLAIQVLADIEDD